MENSQAPTPMEAARQAQLVEPPAGFEKTKFAMICGQAALDRDFEIDDPMCEMCLETCTWCEEKDFQDDLLCNDTFFNKDVPDDDIERLAQAKAYYDAWATKQGRKPAYKWQVVEKYGDEHVKFFMEVGQSSKADSEGCVYALSFYTGEGYTECGRGASLALRQGNLTAEKDEEFAKEIAVVSYHLTSAMSSLPSFWGEVTRLLDLDKANLELYKKGHIVTWFQWASCKKGTGSASAFAGKNTIMHIWSISGKYIDAYSNYGRRFGNDEDEVLLMPCSRLLVLRVEVIDGKNHIYLRQLELGITKGLPLLWVDDKILQENAEMKRELHEAQIKRRQDHVIKFILKPSTDLALAYLRSPFGRCHFANSCSKLRILSDMNRPEEEDGDQAGAKLVKALQDEFHSKFPVTIFTSDKQKGLTKLSNAGADATAKGLEVTVSAMKAVEFASWKDELGS